MMAQRPLSAIDRAFSYVILCVAYLGTYFVTTVVPMRMVWYLPLDHTFEFTQHPLRLGMDFPGRLGLCLLVSAVTFLAVRLGLRSGALRPQRLWLQAAMAWAGTLLAFTVGLYLYTLSRREPVPAPIPPGYVAR